MGENNVLNLLEDCIQDISGKYNQSILSEIRNNIIQSNEEGNCIFQLWDVIDDQVGKHYNHINQSVFIELRRNYLKKIFPFEKSRLDFIFSKSPESGWREWVMLIANSITKFRIVFHSEFCKFEFPFPDEKAEEVKKLRKAVQYILQRYWVGAYEMIEFLSILDFIPTELKAELLVILGEIQQFHLFKPYKALVFFNNAERIASENIRVLSSRGKFLSEQGDTNESKNYYTKLLSLYPHKASGYVGMGDLAEKENGDAEIWYKDAIKYSAGDSDGYLELIKYYIRTNSKENIDLIAELQNRLLLISPESDYGLCLHTGYEYEKTNNYSEAFIQYNKAYNLNSNYQNAISNLGSLFLNINYIQDFQKARSYFEKIIEFMPDFEDSYFNIAYSYEIENNWYEALTWYEKCPDVIMEYRDKLFALKGESYRHLKEFKKAEMNLKEAFQYDNNSPWAKTYTQFLAKDFYQINNDKETAKKLYDVILENIGEEFHADYYNLIGNMRYYFSDNEEAVEQYKKAVQIFPGNAVFHRNLSGAYQELMQYEKAIYEIEKAFDIDSNEIVKNQKLANIHNAMGNDLFSGGKYAEAILEYTEAVKLTKTNDIYYSNLAGAYKNLKDNTCRLESIDKAISYYQKAWDINPKDEYTNNINFLLANKKYISNYGEKVLDKLPFVTPIEVEVASNLIPLVESEGGGLSLHFQKLVNLMRDSLQNEIGHKKIPGIRIKGNETDLPDGTYIIMINEIPIVSGHVRQDRILVNETLNRLQLLDIKEGEEALNPANGSECAWIPCDSKVKAENSGLKTWGILEYIVLHLTVTIRNNFGEFITVQDTSEEIVLKASSFFKEIQEATGGVVRFAEVLKILVEESVPIIELETICKTYLASKDAPICEIVEEIRYNDKISPSLIGNKSSPESCNVYKLGNDIISLINNGILTNGDAALLALEPEPIQRILTAVRNEVSKLSPTTLNPVILTEDSRIRRHFRKLVELEFPHLAVMSKREIYKEVQTLATITLE
jgi:tetratricopeptide (TPR) repeat protein